jgi:hypothetical protein
VEADERRSAVRKGPRLLVLAALAASDTACAQRFESFQFTYDDLNHGSKFGSALAHDGDLVVVGAPEQAWVPGDNTLLAGAAYVFDARTGALLRVLHLGVREADHFGVAVALSGSKAVVGAHRFDGVDQSSGAAFVSDVVDGVPIAQLMPDDGQRIALFGHTAAISGSTVVVGAPYDTDPFDHQGAAYVFDLRDGWNWTQEAKLQASDPGPGDEFGSRHTIATNGEVTLVGAPFHYENNRRTGAAYLFDTSTGQQLATLFPDEGTEYRMFGWSVALSDDTAVVGDPGDLNSFNRYGSAYLFDIATAQQIAKLDWVSNTVGDQFGYSVGISDATVIVGAPHHRGATHRSGAAYLFDARTGARIVELAPSDPVEYLALGTAVDIGMVDQQLTAFVGAPGDGYNGFKFGSVYAFDAVGTPRCGADLNADGVVDTRDLVAFLGAWAAGRPIGDWDGNRVINTQDFLAYLNDWAAGCP